MSSREFKRTVELLLVDHEFIPLVSPNKNAHVESFILIVDNQLQEQFFYTYNDAVNWMSTYVDFYKNDRIHGSLGMSPREFIEMPQIHTQEKFVQAI